MGPIKKKRVKLTTTIDEDILLQIKIIALKKKISVGQLIELWYKKEEDGAGE